MPVSSFYSTARADMLTNAGVSDSATDSTCRVTSQLPVSGNVAHNPVHNLSISLQARPRNLAHVPAGTSRSASANNVRGRTASSQSSRSSVVASAAVAISKRPGKPAKMQTLRICLLPTNFFEGHLPEKTRVLANRLADVNKAGALTKSSVFNLLQELKLVSTIDFDTATTEAEINHRIVSTFAALGERSQTCHLGTFKDYNSTAASNWKTHPMCWAPLHISNKRIQLWEELAFAGMNAACRPWSGEKLLRRLGRDAFFIGEWCLLILQANHTDYVRHKLLQVVSMVFCTMNGSRSSMRSWKQSPSPLQTMDRGDGESLNLPLPTVPPSLRDDLAGTGNVRHRRDDSRTSGQQEPATNRRRTDEGTRADVVGSRRDIPVMFESCPLLGETNEDSNGGPAGTSSIFYDMLRQYTNDADYPAALHVCAEEADLPTMTASGVLIGGASTANTATPTPAESGVDAAIEALRSASASAYIRPAVRNSRPTTTAGVTAEPAQASSTAFPATSGQTSQTGNRSRTGEGVSAVIDLDDSGAESDGNWWDKDPPLNSLSRQRLDDRLACCSTLLEWMALYERAGPLALMPKDYLLDSTRLGQRIQLADKNIVASNAAMDGCATQFIDWMKARIIEGIEVVFARMPIMHNDA